MNIMATPVFSAPSSSSGPFDVICDDDSLEDACSICLEPFSSLDPASVTKCKHEYHLHCILEWTQRRSECPICLQHLVLKDPVSQELLAGVESDRNLRSRREFSPVNQNSEVNNDALHVDESDFEQRILRNFAAIASRARNISRRRREMTTTIAPSQILPTVPISNTPNLTRVNSSSSYHQNTASCFSDMESAANVNHPASPMMFPSLSQSPSGSPGRSSSSEFAAFSESLKSKISTASIRYKESISKSTRSLKEKFVAHNDSVKELSKGVQRETSAGIARIAKMIERLDITQKRARFSGPLSGYKTGSSPHEITDIEDDTGETSNGMIQQHPQFITNKKSEGVEVFLAKEKN